MNLLIKTTLCILLDYIYIYYKLIHGPYNVKLQRMLQTVSIML